MQSPLKFLEGRVLDEVVKIHDYIQLTFSEGWRLNIYYEYSFKAKKIVLDIDELVGLKVVSTGDEEETAKIDFAGDTSISIRLDDEASAGPEARTVSS